MARPSPAPTIEAKCEHRRHLSVFTLRLEVAHDVPPNRLEELLTVDVRQALLDRGCVVDGVDVGHRAVTDEPP